MAHFESQNGTSKWDQNFFLEPDFIHNNGLESIGCF